MRDLTLRNKSDGTSAKVRCYEKRVRLKVWWDGGDWHDTMLTPASVRKLRDLLDQWLKETPR